MKEKEYIAHEPGNREAWVCFCKNTPAADGFYPCDQQGKQVEPVRGWGGLYVCYNCGRIIDPETLEVVGRFQASHELEQSSRWKTPVLSLGWLVMMPRAAHALELSNQSPTPFLARYLSGDWGECGAEDWKSNDEAIEHGDRVHAVYSTAKGETLWVISEADRSVTTFLLPDEY